MKIAFTRRQKYRYAALAVFVLVGWLQQKYVKYQAQADYEQHCRLIENDPRQTPCLSRTPPDFPLPARG